MAGQREDASTSALKLFSVVCLAVFPIACGAGDNVEHAVGAGGQGALDASGDSGGDASSAEASRSSTTTGGTFGEDGSADTRTDGAGSTGRASSGGSDSPAGGSTVQGGGSGGGTTGDAIAAGGAADGGTEGGNSNGGFTAQGGSPGGGDGGVAGASGADGAISNLDAEAGGTTRQGPFFCIPHGPCRIAHFEANHGCVETTLPDGAPCNDGHVCTRGDHCESGQCVGSPVESEAREEALVHGFGGYSETGWEATQYGLAVPLSEKQLVFADARGTRDTAITLVNVTDEGALEVADRFVSPIRMIRAEISSWVFASESQAALIPLGKSRFVFTCGASQVFDVVDGQLKPSEVYRDALRSVAGAVGRENRYWTCDESGITGYVIDKDPVTIRQTSHDSLSYCHALALSDDGDVLFAATNNGLVRFATDGAATLQLTNTYSTSTAYFNVAVQGDFLLAQEMWAPDGYGPLRSYRWSNDMEPLGFYPQDGRSSPEVIGSALLGSRILVERFVQTPTGDPLSMRSLSPVDFVSIAPDVTFFSRRMDGSQYFKIVHPSAGQGLVVTQPVRRALRPRSSDGTLEALSGQLQGFFESVYPVDATHVVSIDAFSRHDIDLTAPDSPKVVTTPLAGSQPARLVLGRTSETAVWIDAVPLDFGPPKYFDLASITDPQGFTRHGRVRIDAARLATSGDEVVGMTFDPTNDRFRAQIFPLNELDLGQSDSDLAFTSEFWIQGTPRPKSSLVRAVMPAEVGADANSLVVAEHWLGLPNTYLHWLPRRGGKFQGNAAAFLAIEGLGTPVQVLVSGSSALVASGLGNLTLVSNSDGVLRIEQSKGLGLLGPRPRLLRWTKDYLYVATGARGSTEPPALHLLSPATLDTLVSFPADDLVTSATEVGEHIVAAVYHGLQVYAPPCSK